MKAITIFTDGAAKGNPGPGGYGVVISYADHVVEIGERNERTTNNEMELKAVLEALKVVSKDSAPVAIYSDSKYVVEGAKGWIYNWVKNGWKTKANESVKNEVLWKELFPLLQETEITWHKISGHVGIIGNERADDIASGFGEGIAVDLYSGPKSEYPHDIDNVSYDEEKESQRKAAKKRQAQKAFSYISAVDGVVEIHRSWDECKKRVSGKVGAKFKKALNAKEQKQIAESFK